MKPKLIMVEGVPGSGKSSTAKFIAEWLETQGMQCEVFIEGNVHHPADFESVACFTRAQFEEFAATHSDSEEILRGAMTSDGNDVFIEYGKLAHENRFPRELLEAVSRYDVYELASDRYCSVLLQRWDMFARRQANANTVAIFECCFLQNALCHLFIRNDETDQYTSNHILALSRVIEKLNPILIYLNPSDVQETIRKVTVERPKQWLDFVIWYHTQQGYGLTRGLSGMTGYVAALEARQALEVDILSRLPMNVVHMDDPQTDWPAAHRTIQERIRQYSE